MMITCEFVVTEVVDIEPAGQPSSQAAIGVLHSALLPRGVGVAEPGRHVQRLPQQLVMSELGSIVEGDGLAQVSREAAEDVHDNGSGLGGVLAGKPRGQGEAALALVKDENGTGAPAEDQITLPVPDFLTRINDLRPVMGGCAILVTPPPPRLLRLPRRLWRRHR